MTDADLKQLKKLLKTLSAEGVTSFEGMGVKLVLDSRPQETASTSVAEALPSDHDLTPEEMLFYSVRPTPESADPS